MLKKTIISLMLCSTVMSWSYATFKMFAPTEEPTTNVASMEEFITTSQMLNARALPETEEQSIVFYYDNDEDSDYVIDQILCLVARDLNLTSTYELPFKFMLVSDLEYTTASKLKSEYGFSSFPALVVYEADDENIMHPVTALEYDVKKPFTKSEVENWLDTNTNISFE